MPITLDWVLILFAAICMFVATFSGYIGTPERPAIGRINWMCFSFLFLIITLLTP
jgi:hypothetical protein